MVTNVVVFVALVLSFANCNTRVKRLINGKEAEVNPSVVQLQIEYPEIGTKNCSGIAINIDGAKVIATSAYCFPRNSMQRIIKGNRSTGFNSYKGTVTVGSGNVYRKDLNTTDIVATHENLAVIINAKFASEALESGADLAIINANENCFRDMLKDNLIHFNDNYDSFVELSNHIWTEKQQCEVVGWGQKLDVNPEVTNAQDVDAVCLQQATYHVKGYFGNEECSKPVSPQSKYLQKFQLCIEAVAPIDRPWHSAPVPADADRGSPVFCQTETVQVESTPADYIYDQKLSKSSWNEPDPDYQENPATRSFGGSNVVESHIHHHFAGIVADWRPDNAEFSNANTVISVIPVKTIVEFVNKMPDPICE